MSANFTAASTQYLSRTGAVLAVPFTVGMWVNLDAVGTVARTLWAHSDTGTTNHYWMLRMTSAEAPNIVARAGGTEAGSGTASAMQARKWHYILCRFITATNRRISTIYNGNGFTADRIQHGQNVTSRNPAGTDTTTIGALSTSGGITEPWGGMIAEYFLASGDVQPDGAQITNATLQQIAYRSPFSLPHIRNNIIEYRSFLSGVDSREDTGNDVYNGPNGRQIWTNNAGVSRGPHPQLLFPDYYRPTNVRNIAMI